MSQTFLDRAEDLQWLRETHLPSLRVGECVVILHGNEDCPERLDVYARNHCQCEPTVFALKEDGSGYDLVVQGEYEE